MNPDTESATALEKIGIQCPWTATSVRIAQEMADGTEAVHLVSLRPLTNCLILTFNKDGQQLILKTEHQDEFGEIGNNLAGYQAMPVNIRPKVIDTGRRGEVDYLLMEHGGSSLKKILSTQDTPVEVLNGLRCSLSQAYEYSAQANQEQVLMAWRNLTTMSPANFSFGFMLDRIDRKCGFDSSRMRGMLQTLNTNIRAERLPSISHWSPGDLTANHIFFNGQNWLVIDPKPFPWGLPEIDLGRLYAQINMYTTGWSDTFNTATEVGNVITQENAEASMAMINSLAISLRKMREPNLNPDPFFKLGIAWQNIIGIQARDGDRLYPLFLETERLISDILIQLV